MAFYPSLTTAVSMALLLTAIFAASAASHDDKTLFSTSYSNNGQPADAVALRKIDHVSVVSGSARQPGDEEQEANAHVTSRDSTDADATPSGSGRGLQSAIKEDLDNAFHMANRMLSEQEAAPAPAPILVDFPGGGVQVSSQGVHVQFPGGAVNIGRKLKNHALQLV